LTLAAKIHERKREKTPDRTVELIERCIELGEKQIGGFAALPKLRSELANEWWRGDGAGRSKPAFSAAR
jgi:hypothetical protein